MTPDYYGKISLVISKSVPAIGRISAFFGHYDCRVYLSDTAYVDLGAGSLRCIERIKSVNFYHVGLVGSIGRFCEFNNSCEIMGGGDHDHDVPVNATFSVFPFLRATNAHKALLDPTPFTIGSGVIISAGARVLSGVTIGDGAVVGANALVTRDVEPYSIVAGAPARELRKRTPAKPWWDFHPAYLLSNLANIQELAISDGPHEWREDRPAFVFHIRSGSINLEGFLVDNQTRPLSEAPQSVQRYAHGCLNLEGTPYWVADCWKP